MVNLIIGANGFLGSALLDYARYNLEQEEWIGITRENYERWKMYRQGFDKVIWVAGLSSKPQCNKNYMECWRKNVIELKAAKMHFPCNKFIYISSFDVYPPDVLNPSEQDEGNYEVITNKEWHGGNNPRFSLASNTGLSNYGITKLAGEHWAKKAVKEGQSYFIARCNGFVGHGLKKNVVYDLLQPQPKIYVDPASEFQFIHTEDFAKILFSLIDNYSDTVFNLTSPDAISCTEIAELLGVDDYEIEIPYGKEDDNIVNAIMNTEKLYNALISLGITIPSSREAIERYKWNTNALFVGHSGGSITK